MLHLTVRRIPDVALNIPGADPWFADPEDPAITVMTDFRERASVTVDETSTIDLALEHMKHTGIRCAFAIDSERRVVVGMITAYDIQSEKPMQASLHTPRGEVLVRDIMQKISDWRIITVDELSKATVGSLRRLFDETRLSHIPVMETVDGGKPVLRGLLSAAKVKRLLSRSA
jgi:CBS domain-containing protein